MKVLLFEQWSGGHYANYMNCLVPEVATLSDRLVIAVGEKMRNSPEALDQWARLPNVEFAPVLPHVSPALTPRDRIAATRNLLRTLRAVRPDFTIIPSADAQSSGLAALSLLGFDVAKRYGPIEGTLHYGYGYSAQTLKERAKEWVYGQTYRHLPYSSVNFVNFAYYEYAIDKQLVAPDRMRFVGDPVPQGPRIGRHAARRALGLNAEGRYIGIIGSLDRRKAIPQLLSAFRQADLPADVHLLLAGRLDHGYALLLNEQYGDLVRAGRVVVMDRFLTDDELGIGYEALDVATIVYNRLPVLASLALKAVAAGTPIVADDFGWLGIATRRFGLGTCIDIDDQSAFASALRASINNVRVEPDSEVVRRLLSFHTEQNFVVQMTRELRRRQGSAPVHSIDWAWVLEAVLPETAQ